MMVRYGKDVVQIWGTSRELYLKVMTTSDAATCFRLATFARCFRLT